MFWMAEQESNPLVLHVWDVETGANYFAAQGANGMPGTEHLLLSLQGISGPEI